MRTTKDRVRQAVSFEVIGLILITPLGSLVFAEPLEDIGIIAIVGATVATIWNYVFNLLFDHALLRLRSSVHKTLMIRVLHAAMFEAGILAVLLPFIAWYLDITLMQAFLIDVSFAAFYLIYTFVFTWAYDMVFPVANGATASKDF